jgi:hypothetical protein
MNTFTSTYRQTWKVGLVIVLATCSSALLATHSTHGPATPAHESKAMGQTPQPAFGSNSWFGLYATDAAVLTD